MIGLLQWLVDFFAQLVCWIMTALMGFLNLMLVAIGGLIEAAIMLLPDMPTVPGVPSEVTQVLAWINWFFPVGTVVSFFTFFLAAWILWQLVVILLRWAKASNA